MEMRSFDRFRRWGVVAWSAIGLLICLVVLGWTVYHVREVFQPLVLALVIVFILNPLVSRMHRAGVPRLAGSCLTYTLFLGIVGLLALLVAPLIANQFREFVDDFPQTAARVSRLANTVDGWIAARFPNFDLSAWIVERASGFGEGFGRIGGFLLGAVHTLAVLILGPVIGFYLLLDMPRLQRTALKLISPRRREEVVGVASQVSHTMGSFFRGQLVVALIVGIMSSIGMKIIGLPYWLLVGMVAGFFNLIPLIGPFIGAIPGLIIAGALKSPITMVLVAIVMLVVQQIDNHFISPNVMRLAVRVRPVTVMVSLIAGASLAGFWGMLFAVPFVASLRVVLSHLWRTRVPWGEEVFQPDVQHAAPETGSFPPGDPSA